MSTKQESDLLTTSMITDRIGQHEILLPINQNYDEICERNWNRLNVFIKKMTVNSANARQQRAHVTVLSTYTGMTC